MAPSAPEIAIDYTLAFAFCRWCETGTFASDASTSKGLAPQEADLMQVNEKLHPGMTGAKGEPMTYQCSLCGHLFLVPDDRSVEDAAAELMAAFEEHVGTCRGSEGLRWAYFL